MPHDRGERAASRQLFVVHHAGLEVGQLARRLPRAETSRRAGQPDDRDGAGAGAEKEPDRGVDFPRREPATRVAHDALEMMNLGTGENHFLRDNRTTAMPTISNLDISFKNVVILDTTGGVIYSGIREAI